MRNIKGEKKQKTKGNVRGGGGGGEGLQMREKSEENKRKCAGEYSRQIREESLSKFKMWRSGK